MKLSKYIAKHLEKTNNAKLRYLGIDSWDGLLVILIFLKEFLLDFLGLGMLSNIVICIGVLARLTWSNELKRYSRVLIVFAPSLLLQIYSRQNLIVYAGNVARLVQVLIYLAYFGYLINKYYSQLLNMNGRLLQIFNFVWLINIIIIVIQVLTHGLMVSPATGGAEIIEDTYSGLFGPKSTHAVALFTTFVAMINLRAVLMEPSCKSVRLYLLRFTTVVILSLVVAGLNDNKALFLLMPVGLSVEIVISICCLQRNRRTVIKALAVTIVGVFLLVCAISPLREKVGVLCKYFISTIARAIRPGAYSNGSDERIAIIARALSMPSSWLVGLGFGSGGMYQEGFCGFGHFGQSDFGSLVILGGLWFYLSITAVYVRVFLPVGVNGKHRLGPALCLAVFILIGSLYTQTYSQVRIAIPTFLICFEINQAFVSCQLKGKLINEPSCTTEYHLN